MDIQTQEDNANILTESEKEQVKTITKYIVSMSRVAREFMFNALEKESVKFSDLFVPLEQEDAYNGKAPSDTFFVTKAVDINGEQYIVDSSIVSICLKLLRLNCKLRQEGFGPTPKDSKLTILDLNNIATEMLNEINYCAYYINHYNLSGFKILHSEMLLSDDDLGVDVEEIRPYSRICKYYSRVLGISLGDKLGDKYLNLSVEDRVTSKKLNEMALFLSSLCEKYLIKLGLNLILESSSKYNSSYTIWYKMSDIRAHQLRNVLLMGKGDTDNPIKVRENIFKAVNDNLNKLGFGWMLFASEDDANVLGFFIKIKYKGLVESSLANIIDERANSIWVSNNEAANLEESFISEIYARNPEQ